MVDAIPRQDPDTHSAFRPPQLALLVFTDLDGTLLDHHSYSFSAALPALQRLRRARIPVIPVTSKTLAELAPLMRELDNAHPCIAENGGLIALLSEQRDLYRQLDISLPHRIAQEPHMAELAQRVESQVRASDVAARYGGEEFAVILPETDVRAEVEIELGLPSPGAIPEVDPAAAVERVDLYVNGKLVGSAAEPDWSVAWGLGLRSFDEVVDKTIRRSAERSETARRDLWEFSKEMVRAYVGIPGLECHGVSQLACSRLRDSRRQLRI